MLGALKIKPTGRFALLIGPEQEAHPDGAEDRMEFATLSMTTSRVEHPLRRFGVVPLGLEVFDELLCR
jgi:hypothetical protein